MELTFSKRNLSITAVVLLVGTALLSLANRYDVLGALKTVNLFAKSEPSNEQPAAKALETILSPANDQDSWNDAVCVNMTPEGCGIFKGLYSNALWGIPHPGATVTFVKVAEEFEDGTQVWEMSVLQIGNDTAIPAYIHVEKGEKGEWLLVRILFDAEAARYAQP